MKGTDKKLKAALAMIDNEPELEVTQAPVLQGMTNRVLFGTFHDQPVAIKSYAKPRRRAREAKALALLKNTGVVPAVIPFEHELLLLTEILPGTALNVVCEKMNSSDLQEIYRGIGAALAAIERLSPEPEEAKQSSPDESNGNGEPTGYLEMPWPNLVDAYIDLALDTLPRAELPEFCDEARADLAWSLNDISSGREELKQGRQFFLGHDFGDNNVIVYNGRFQGFVDLESSGYGTAEYIVGTGLFHAWRSDTPDQAPVMIQGYCDAIGESATDAFRNRCHRFAAFGSWGKFGAFFNLKSLPQWMIDLNQRQVILEQLLLTIRKSRKARTDL